MVVDFCAFRWRDVQSVTKGLTGITRLYVLISSDSIYNNSRKFSTFPIQEAQFDLETEYKRFKALKIKKDVDKYGYVKSSKFRTSLSVRFILNVLTPCLMCA